jgi:hypothetical protein
MITLPGYGYEYDVVDGLRRTSSPTSPVIDNVRRTGPDEPLLHHVHLRLAVILQTKDQTVSYAFSFLADTNVQADVFYISGCKWRYDHITFNSSTVVHGDVVLELHHSSPAGPRIGSTATISLAKFPDCYSLPFPARKQQTAFPALPILSSSNLNQCIVVQRTTGTGLLSPRSWRA